MELDYVCPSVRHHFEDDHYFFSYASQTPITIHILKAYDECYSKIIRRHKYKDKDNDKDNDKDKGTDKVPKNPTYAIQRWNLLLTSLTAGV